MRRLAEASFPAAGDQRSTTPSTYFEAHEQKSRGLSHLRLQRFARWPPVCRQIFLRTVRHRECIPRIIRASAGVPSHQVTARFQPKGVAPLRVRVRFESHPWQPPRARICEFLISSSAEQQHSKERKAFEISSPIKKAKRAPQCEVPDIALICCLFSERPPFSRRQHFTCQDPIVFRSGASLCRSNHTRRLGGLPHLGSGFSRGHTWSDRQDCRVCDDVRWTPSISLNMLAWKLECRCPPGPSPATANGKDAPVHGVMPNTTTLIIWGDQTRRFSALYFPRLVSAWTSQEILSSH